MVKTEVFEWVKNGRKTIELSSKIIAEPKELIRIEKGK